MVCEPRAETAKVTAQFMDGNWKVDVQIYPKMEFVYKDTSDQDFRRMDHSIYWRFAYMNENMILKQKEDNHRSDLATVKRKNRKENALSFDDGPRAETTPKGRSIRNLGRI